MYCNCMNNQQVCIHVCQHILLFTVQRYLYCVHFLQCYFLDKRFGGGGV